jgi:hypothetical protein
MMTISGKSVSLLTCSMAADIDTLTLLAAIAVYMVTALA